MARQKPEPVWRSGFRSGGVDPAAAAQELARIEKTYGALTAPDVVAEARPEDAVLHPAFEWDDSVAGELYRREQASRLIRAVAIARPDSEPVRTYVHVPGKRSTYQRMTTAAKHDDSRVQALIHLRQQLNEAEYSLNEFKAACEMAGADEVTMARLSIAAEAAAAFRSAVDALH